MRPSRIIARGFQAYWRASRGLVLHVEGCLVGGDGAVLLVRAGNGGGWRLPGMTIETTETTEAALWRALGPYGIAQGAVGADLFWIYAGTSAKPWDALALYRLRGISPAASAGAAYFAADTLAGVCDAATLARIRDAVAGRTPFELC